MTMEKLFGKELEDQIRNLLSHMKNKITLVLFLDGNCSTCKETRQMLSETKALSDKIELIVHELSDSPLEAKKYNIERAPSFVILDSLGVYRGVKFSGIPAGHEINSFLTAILEMSGMEFGMNPELRTRISSINKPVDIKVFVSLACPHCPRAVENAFRLAMRNGHIRAEMIETQIFRSVAEKYHVSGVPKIVINDSVELLGDQPIEAFIQAIERLQ